MQKAKTKKTTRTKATKTAVARVSRKAVPLPVEGNLAVDTAEESSDEQYMAQMFAALGALPPLKPVEQPVQQAIESSVEDTAIEAACVEVVSIEPPSCESPSIESLSIEPLPECPAVEEQAVVSTDTSLSETAADALLSGAEVPIDGEIVVLAEQCLMRDAVALREQLQSLMTQATVAINASGVERVDTAAMQVLLAFARDRAKLGLSLTWQGRSDVFNEAAQLLGIHSMLASQGAA